MTKKDKKKGKTIYFEKIVYEALTKHSKITQTKISRIVNYLCKKSLLTEATYTHYCIKESIEQVNELKDKIGLLNKRLQYLQQMKIIEQNKK